MSDQMLLISVVVGVGLGGVVAGAGVHFIREASHKATTSLGKLGCGCAMGCSFGIVVSLVFALVVSTLSKEKADYWTAALIGCLLGTLAGWSASKGGTIGGALAGLLLGNLENPSFGISIAGMLGGVIGGLLTASAYDREHNEGEDSEADGDSHSEHSEDDTPEPTVSTAHRFDCPHCAARLKARSCDEGRMTKCTRCSERIQIPAA